MSRPTCEETFVLSNRRLANNYYSLTVGPYRHVKSCRPGNFIHLQLPHSEVFFRRAMSVAAVDVNTRTLEIIYKVYGRGTSLLKDYRKQAPINLLGPLGKPFALPKKNEHILLVGGGVGFPPLLFLATHLVRRGFPAKQIEFFYGGRTAEEIVDRSRIRKLGVNFHPVTDDGSFGEKGLVTQAVEGFITQHQGASLRLYGCGPEGMLKATDELGRKYHVPGQLSLEAPMPCGIGICLGCVVPLRQGGYARVCADGPVFDIGEVIL
ncbi:MAG: dihydroorotate dehydrogenase electron transfer subunit [Candidatus Zixiibacteriota bacterium]|nr:MAG: dihydroorotate dehydrogenase electron transfer subunit [candidate division Zixibacteria bacterium]